MTLKKNRIDWKAAIQHQTPFISQHLAFSPVQ